MPRSALLCAVLAAALAACTAGRPGPPPPTATTVPRPAGLSATVDNPWFPLTPGRTLVYRGVKDGQRAREEVTAAGTQRVGGVRCRVVLDRLYLDGRLAESTRDYYAQDAAGAVWYFGEDTAELDAAGNMVTTEGTWHAGEGGARPGIFMPAHPRVGEVHRQEYLAGHAEDWFQVLAVSADGRLLTKEWTPLEPDALDHKTYVRGIGTVAERSVRGPKETLTLVRTRAR